MEIIPLTKIGVKNDIKTVYTLSQFYVVYADLIKHWWTDWLFIGLLIMMIWLSKLCVWPGRNCETRASKCDGDVCQNGGQCHVTSNNTGHYCECATEWTGAHCETKLHDCPLRCLDEVCMQYRSSRQMKAINLRD